jgi:hypothetical protein
MNDNTVNRRGALAVLGLGVVGALAARNAQAATGSAQAAQPASQEKTSNPNGPAPAIPLGLRAGSYRVASVGSVTFGAVVITLVNDAEDRFNVDVCARDSGLGALNGPAHTERLELFLVNEGDGSSPTHEAHGLAAMALAEALRGYEDVILASPLLTMRERLQRHGTLVLAP